MSDGRATSNRVRHDLGRWRITHMRPPRGERYSARMSFAQEQPGYWVFCTRHHLVTVLRRDKA